MYRAEVWGKLNDLKPLFNRNEEFYVSKEVKESTTRIRGQIMPTRNNTLRNSDHNLTQPSYNNRYYHHSFTYKASHLWNQLPSYIKRSTELSEYRKHLRSFNLTILRASCKCNFCISYGFTISVFFSLKVLNFFLPFLVFN